MSAPLIYSGRRAKLLTQDGLLRPDGSIIDNNGIVNLIKNGHAEVNTTGWTVSKNTSAASRPDSGFVTSSTNITWTRNTTNPIDGQADFLYTKDAANRQGEQVYYGFTVSKKHRAKVVQIEVDYLVNSGTFSAGSNSTDSDIIVCIYDVTNSIFIEPSSFKFLSNSSTIADKFIANFQTSATGSSYRILFHQATTSSSAFTVQFKEIKISPCQYVYGTPVSDWVSYTPTIVEATTNRSSEWTTLEGRWRRLGDSIDVIVNGVRNGSASSGAGGFMYVTLPSGVVLDATTTWPVGTVFKSNSNTVQYSLQSSGANGFWVIDLYGSAALAYNDTNFPGSTSWGFRALDKVVGWSSSTQVSDGYDARVIGLKVNSTGTTGTLNTSDNVVKHAATTINDTTVSYSASTGLWTCPRSDWYIVSGSYAISHTTASGYISASIGVNGTIVAEDYKYVNGAADSQQSVQSQAIYITAGQTVGLYSRTSLTTPAFTATSKNNWFSIIAAKSPTTISATEKLIASYGDNSGQSITTSNQIIGFNTLTEDTHAIKSGTGTSTQFIIPYQGSFRIFTQLQTGATTSSGNQYFIPKIYIDGSAVAEGGNRFPTSHISPTGTVEWTGPLNAGQIVTIRLDTDVAASRSLSSSAASNRMSIIRIK